MSYPNFLLWWGVFLVLTVVFYSFIFIKIKSIAKESYKKWVMIFLIFPFTITPLYYVGHYDLITIFGAVIAGFSNKKVFVFVGAFLAVSANPEQAIFTSACLLLLAFGSKIEWHACIAKIWLALSISTFVLINLFLGTATEGNRAKIILAEFKEVILDSAGLVHLIIFSVFSVGWIILGLFYSANLGNTRNIFVLLSVVVIPVLLSITILDRTRIGVAVGALPLILLLRGVMESDLLANTNTVKIRQEYLFYALVLTPTLIVDTDGSLRLPYLELINKFIV
jgi:hypothetical protein